MILDFIARVILWWTGWKLEGERPKPTRYVLIAAPHTTNWDFPYTLALARVARVRIQWLGKHTLFRWPFGPFFRALGGISVQVRLQWDSGGKRCRSSAEFWP